MQHYAVVEGGSVWERYRSRVITAHTTDLHELDQAQFVLSKHKTQKSSTQYGCLQYIIQPSLKAYVCNCKQSYIN